MKANHFCGGSARERAMVSQVFNAKIADRRQWTQTSFQRNLRQADPVAYEPMGLDPGIFDAALEIGAGTCAGPTIKTPSLKLGPKSVFVLLLLGSATAASRSVPEVPRQQKATDRPLQLLSDSPAARFRAAETAAVSPEYERRLTENNRAIDRSRQRRRLPDVLRTPPSVPATAYLPQVEVEKLARPFKIKRSYTWREGLDSVTRAVTDPFPAFGQDLISLVEWVRDSDLNAANRRRIAAIATGVGYVDQLVTSFHWAGFVRGILGQGLTFTTQYIDDTIDVNNLPDGSDFFLAEGFGKMMGGANPGLGIYERVGSKIGKTYVGGPVAGNPGNAFLPVRPKTLTATGELNSRAAPREMTSLDQPVVPGRTFKEYTEVAEPAGDVALDTREAIPLEGEEALAQQRACRGRRAPGEHCRVFSVVSRTAERLSDYLIPHSEIQVTSAINRHGLYEHTNGASYMRGTRGFYKVVRDSDQSFRAIRPESEGANMDGVYVERTADREWVCSETEIDKSFERRVHELRITDEPTVRGMLPQSDGTYRSPQGHRYIVGNWGYYRIVQDAFGSRVVPREGPVRPLDGVSVKRAGGGLWTEAVEAERRPRLDPYDKNYQLLTKQIGAEVLAVGLQDISLKFPRVGNKIMETMVSSEAILARAVETFTSKPEHAITVISKNLGIPRTRVDADLLWQIKLDVMKLQARNQHFIEGKGRAVIYGKHPTAAAFAYKTADFIFYAEAFVKQPPASRAWTQIHETSHIYKFTSDYFYNGLKQEAFSETGITENRIRGYGHASASKLPEFNADRSGQFIEATGASDLNGAKQAFRSDAAIRTKILRGNADSMTGLVFDLSRPFMTNDAHPFPQLH